MEVVTSSKKFYQLAMVRSSESDTVQVVNSILGNAQLQLFSRNVMHNYKNQMAKQIVHVQSQSIEQIRSLSPPQPYSGYEDPKPAKLNCDTIRPYSAKVERNRKIQTTQPTNRNSKRYSVMRNLQSAKSLRSSPFISINGIYKDKSQKKQLLKYKSRLVPLKSFQQNQQCDKIIEQLRKNKIKAEEYEKSKQNFIKSIYKQNEQYIKKQFKFANSMTRKDYTYNNNCQIMEIIKQKPKSMKKSSTLKGQTINNFTKSNQNQIQKARQIAVQFVSRQPRTQLKQFVFNANTQLKLQSLCPSNTMSTKFSLVVQDC